MRDIDIEPNLKNGFKYPPLKDGGIRNIRVLRPKFLIQDGELSFVLEEVALEEVTSFLGRIYYKALSYTWGQADIPGALVIVAVNGQDFYIRRNLYNFLLAALVKGEYGPFFIDAICINQTDNDGRRKAIHNMKYIYLYAREVIAWLGQPAEGIVDDLRCLQAWNSHSQSRWTSSHSEAYYYLCYRPYWSRIWVVQEVVLAHRMSVWCGDCTFPLTLFDTTPAAFDASAIVVFDDAGSSAQSEYAITRPMSPAHKVITYRTWQVSSPESPNRLKKSEMFSTLEPFASAQRRPYRVTKGYQPVLPYALSEVFNHFGQLECSDPRDKLYGLLGILSMSTRASVYADCDRDVDYACYQALRVGIHDLIAENKSTSCVTDELLDRYLVFYHNTRDWFGLSDTVSLPVLQRLLDQMSTRGMERLTEHKINGCDSVARYDIEVKVALGLKRLLARTDSSVQRVMRNDGEFWGRPPKEAVDKIVRRRNRRLQARLNKPKVRSQGRKLRTVSARRRGVPEAMDLSGQR